VLGYDAIIVLTSSNKSVFLSYNGSVASPVYLYFAGHGLAALENCKTDLEGLIAETSARLAVSLGTSCNDFDQRRLIDRDFSLIEFRQRKLLWVTACGSDGDLIDCRMPSDLASALSPPGCFAPCSTDGVTVSPFVFLSCFFLLGILSEYEELLALVVDAIATLFSRLQTACVSNSIAVCQRSFFTHHGAHPPAHRSQRHLGSFSGRVLQPQVAA
jgi:hypothetical protein